MSMEPSDVFISYNSRDREAARVIVQSLREQQLSVFLDERNLVAGQNFVSSLEQSLGNCQAVAILIGPHGMGKWQQIEKDLALDRKAMQPSLPVVPVLLPGDVDPPTGFLALNTWVDFRQGLNQGEQGQKLAAALRGQAWQGGGLNPVYDFCPYRGLLPFREEDRDFYFGREPDVAELVRLVREDRHPVVPVIGSSGSGKSSLVYAGLIPELRHPSGANKGQQPWEIAKLRPYGDPFFSLASEFSPPAEGLSEAERLASLNRSAQLLRDGEVSLAQLATARLQQSGGCEQLLIFVDQWEELYSQMPTDVSEVDRKSAVADRILFIDALLEAAALPNCQLVFTVRADFYEPLLGWDNQLKHGKLQDHLNRAGLSLGPMDREALRDCIVKPAEKAGYQFADGLVEAILEEVGLEPGQLPLLEFYLRELWVRREGNEFTFQGHRETGGVSGAIARRADEAFAEILQQNNQPLADATRRVFVSLVTPGEGREDTRAVILLPESGLEREVIERFSAHDVRLLTASSGKVEVSHEALIRQWRRLQDDWLRKNRDFLRVRDRIRAARDLWDPPAGVEPELEVKRGRQQPFKRRSKKRLIPRGQMLAEAKALRNNHGDVMIDGIQDYIRQSLRRGFWQRFWRWVVLISVAGVAMVIGFVGLILLFVVGGNLGGEIDALHQYQEDVYEKQIKPPQPPPPLLRQEQANHPFHRFENGAGIEFVWCWPGQFTMGSPIEEPARGSDEAQHMVKLSSGFWMARTEVTQAQWLQVMNGNPSLRKHRELPVSGVSWHDAVKFCEALTRLEESIGALPKDWEYRLPTEAQWEYACRSGTSSPFGTSSLDAGAWHSGKSIFMNRRTAQKQANHWGLFDMHGNAREWCQDRYGRYPGGAVSDPIGPETGVNRVIRGGYAWGVASYCRSANRNGGVPSYRYGFLGFRPVMVPSQASSGS